MRIVLMYSWIQNQHRRVPAGFVWRGDRVVATAESAAVFDQKTQYLVDLPNGVSAIVAGVDVHRAGASVGRRLAEIGFLPGEPIHVIARVPGGGPIAVRIGSSTFALRRHEASCVRLHDPPRARTND
jgi:ferrous iron transport protein A